MADPYVRAMSEEITLVVSAAVLAGDAIGFDGTNWILADANAAAPIRAEYFCLKGAASGDTIGVAKRVTIVDTDAPYTKGALQFLSGTAGKTTETNPAATIATLLQCLGKAVTTSEIYLDADLKHVYVHKDLVSTLPATAGNYGSFYVSKAVQTVIGAAERHAVAGSDGGAVTLTVEKLTSGTALDSGVAALASTWNLKSTADTPVGLAPSATAADTRLKPGDALALKDSGTLTAVAGLAVTVVLVEGIA